MPVAGSQRKVRRILIGCLDTVKLTGACMHRYRCPAGVLALKTLGRTTPCSRIISKREGTCADRLPHTFTSLTLSQNLAILLNAAEKLRSSESDAADESLRCVANALLLVDDARMTWVEIHGRTIVLRSWRCVIVISLEICSVISSMGRRNRLLPILSS